MCDIQKYLESFKEIKRLQPEDKEERVLWAGRQFFASEKAKESYLKDLFNNKFMKGKNKK